MSLLPISEAVQRLESDGLLESRPQIGTRVRIPTEQDVRDRFIIREAPEGQATRLFAERTSLQQRQELKLMAEQMDTLFGRLGTGALEGTEWLPELRMSESPTNDWEPSIRFR